MSGICNTTMYWILLAIVFISTAGQAGLIWFAHWRVKKQQDDARRQARKDQANLIENEFDKLKGYE